MFKAVLVEKQDSDYRAGLTDMEDASLPEGDVTVDIAFSSLNYKDALAITGRSPVVRRFPMIPGIDLTGTVIESNHPDDRASMQVILNGWGVGESHWGGLAYRTTD